MGDMRAIGAVRLVDRRTLRDTSTLWEMLAENCIFFTLTLTVTLPCGSGRVSGRGAKSSSSSTVASAWNVMRTLAFADASWWTWISVALEMWLSPRGPNSWSFRLHHTARAGLLLGACTKS